MYIPRAAAPTVKNFGRQFAVVLVSGPRQVGKTTLLQHTAGDLPSLTMDNAAVLVAAREAPDTFFAYNPPPLRLDEVQLAPELFPAIKQAVDQAGAKGLFYVSGSDQPEMMRQVTESLAGRVGIINLLGLSLRERTGDPETAPFLPTREFLAGHRPHPPLPLAEVWSAIHRGGMPELVANLSFDWSAYYGSYVRTYIERDVRRLIRVGDELKFTAFLRAAAARTGQLLNLAAMASDVGVSQGTVSRWLSVLATANLIYLLRPYHSSVLSRAVKTPKLYFTDTGLAAYLTSWNSPEVIRDGAMSGPFFETFVVSEVLKSYYNAGILDPPLYFYRDRDGREIDLIIERDGALHPVEIKKSASPSSRSISAFGVLDTLNNVRRGEGGIVCLADRLLPLSAHDAVIPVAYL
jgi:predicted AAA+ superfamily ATPase